MRCPPAMGAGRVGLPAPFGEAWRRPLAAGLGDIFVWWVPADSAGALLGQSGMLDGHDWAAIGRIRDVALRDHARATRVALRLALSHVAEGSGVAAELALPADLLRQAARRARAAADSFLLVAYRRAVCDRRLRTRAGRRGYRDNGRDNGRQAARVVLLGGRATGPGATPGGRAPAGLHRALDPQGGLLQAYWHRPCYGLQVRRIPGRNGSSGRRADTRSIASAMPGSSAGTQKQPVVWPTCLWPSMQAIRWRTGESSCAARLPAPRPEGVHRTGSERSCMWLSERGTRPWRPMPAMQRKASQLRPGESPSTCTSSSRRRSRPGPTTSPSRPSARR